MARTDAPDWLLDYFRLRGEVACWATAADFRVLAPRKPRRVWPAGEVAGGREVVGHGRLVSVSNRNILTCDIEAALRKLYTWPWQGSPPYIVPGKPGPLDDERVALIRAVWEIRGGELVWRVSPHSTLRVGAPTVGVPLAGRRNDWLTTYKAVGYRIDDVRHVLEHGRFPWMVEWD